MVLGIENTVYSLSNISHRSMDSVLFWIRVNLITAGIKLIKTLQNNVAEMSSEMVFHPSENVRSYISTWLVYKRIKSHAGSTASDCLNRRKALYLSC